MADLRFSNQGPIVLGLGGTYPSYASIPSVFGGPTQGILISVYNRGGSYVPNTIYNQTIPTTISTGNPVDFSDYYTTSNYNPGPTPVPPIPNPRPTPTPDPHPDSTLVTNISAPQAAYIGNTVNVGSLTTKGVGSTNPYTCQSVTVDGITTANTAVNQQNIQFVVQGGMNYDPSNRSDVLLNITGLSGGYNIPKWFARYAINYSLYGTISNTSAMTGQNVLISNLLSLQTDPQPTITIGGVAQTIVSITPHDNIQNDILIVINEATPTEESDIVITNAKGDSVTLPQQFKRSTNNPLDPTDRGPPPNINWTAQEQLPERLIFTFSSNLAFTNGTSYPSATYTVNQTQRNYTSSNLDPGGGYGNQQSQPLSNDFLVVNNSTIFDADTTFQGAADTTSLVQVGVLTRAVIIPNGTMAGVWAVRMYFRSHVASNIDYSTAYVGLYAATGTSLSTSTSFGTVKYSNSVASKTTVGYLSGSDENYFDANLTLPANITFDYTLFAVNTPVYWFVQTYTDSAPPNNIVGPYTFSDGVSISYGFGGSVYTPGTVPVGTYTSYATYKGVPILNYTGFYPIRAIKYTNPLSTDTETYLIYGFNYLGNGESCLMFWKPKLNNGSSTPGAPSPYVMRWNNGINAGASTNYLTNYNLPVLFTSTTNPSSGPALPLTSWGVFTVSYNNKFFISSYGLPFNYTDNSFTGFTRSSYSATTSSVFSKTGYAGKFYQWGSTVVVISWNTVFYITDLSTLTNYQLTVGNSYFTGQDYTPSFIDDDRLVFTNYDSNIGRSVGYYLNTGSFTPVQVPTFSFPDLGQYFIKLNPNSTTSDLIFSYSLGGTLTGKLSNYLLSYPPTVSWTFNRTASATYTALNLPISLSPTDTNAQRAQSVASALVSNWNGPTTPTYTITTDNSGNTVLDFNTNSIVISGSTLAQTGSTTAGTFTMVTSGGNSSTNSNITRLSVMGAQNQVYIDASYGYVNNGSFFLTFTHDYDGFDSTSTVVQNNYTPTSIKRDVVFI